MLNLWQLRKLWSLCLRSFNYLDVGEPTSHPCSLTGRWPPPFLRASGVNGDIYLRNCYFIVEKYWVAYGFSESVVSHLIFWVSSCGFPVCFWLGGAVFCLFCLVCLGRHLAFCFSPVLLQCENSWSTTRRFDDRQSSERARHGLKKITLLRVIPTMTCWVEVVRWGLSLRIWWEGWRIWKHWFHVSLA